MKAPLRYLDRNMQWKKLFSKTEPFQPAIQYNPAMEPFMKMHLPYKIDYIEDPNTQEEFKGTKEELMKKQQLTKLSLKKSTMPIDQSLGRLCQIFQDFKKDLKADESPMITPPPTPISQLNRSRNTMPSRHTRSSTSTRGQTPPHKRRMSTSSTSRYEGEDRQKGSISQESLQCQTRRRKETKSGK